MKSGESEMQREKEEENKMNLDLCGLEKRIERGEKGPWWLEMSCLTVKLSLPAALFALLGEDVCSDLNVTTTVCAQIFTYVLAAQI